MKKNILFALGVLTFGIIGGAQASSLSGAVSFKKLEAPLQDEAPAKTVDESNTQKLSADKFAVDPKELMAKKTADIDEFDNPRFVKIYYGKMKGLQQAIDRRQQEELAKEEYPTEQAKEKALQEIKGQALIHFDDYADAPEDLQKRQNENPRATMLDMSDRTTYLDKDKSTPEYSEYVKESLEGDFINRTGMTPQEYEKVAAEQTKAELEMRQSEDEKADSFPVLKTDKEVAVEKLDNKSAMIRIAPSKRAAQPQK